MASNCSRSRARCSPPAWVPLLCPFRRWYVGTTSGRLETNGGSRCTGVGSKRSGLRLVTIAITAKPKMKGPDLVFNYVEIRYFVLYLGFAYQLRCRVIPGC